MTGIYIQNGSCPIENLITNFDFVEKDLLEALTRLFSMHPYSTHLKPSENLTVL